jgi:hypothetical protein
MQRMAMDEQVQIPRVTDCANPWRFLAEIWNEFRFRYAAMGCIEIDARYLRGLLKLRR